MDFQYVGVHFTYIQKMTYDVWDQAHKANPIASALTEKNMNMNTRAQSKIDETCIGPVLTYVIETRPDKQNEKNHSTNTWNEEWNLRLKTWLHEIESCVKN